MNLFPRRGRRGFTLLEIMIVVSIVAILSWMAMIEVGRAQQRAVRSVIENNLRQLYQAKEYYFSETGKAGQITILDLVKSGHVSDALYREIFFYGALENKMGWTYSGLFDAGEPTLAYRGIKPDPTDPPSDDAIWYPGPPGSTAVVPPGAQPPANSPSVATPTPANPGTPAVTTPPPATHQNHGNSDFGHSHNPDNQSGF